MPQAQEAGRSWVEERLSECRRRKGMAALGKGCSLVTHNIRASEKGCHDPKLQKDAGLKRCWAGEKLGWGEAEPERC